MMKKLVSIMLALVMALGLLSTTAWADDNLTYLEWQDEAKKLVPVTLASTTLNEVENTTGDATWTAGWYVVEGTVTIGGTVTVEGNVHLLLKNGCDLTINGGIKSNSGNLTIYAQPEDTTPTGKLTVGNWEYTEESSAYNYSILLYALTINGGDVTATAGTPSGESACSYGISVNTFTVNGGTVKATGASVSGNTAESYGIYATSTFTVNGGTVEATGGNASGTDAKSYGICARKLTFNCGTLIAKSGTVSGYEDHAQAIDGSPTLPTDYWWSVTDGGELTASSTPFVNSSEYTYVKLYKEPVVEEATPETPETPDDEPDSEPVSGGHTPIRRQNTVTNTVDTTTDTTRTDTVTSAKTFDTGVAVYAVMAAASLFGMGYVGKKR